MEMEQENIKYFDLPRLLRTDDLNIRRTVENEPPLSVGVYFERLTNFTNLAPAVLNALNRFVNLGGDKEAYKRVEGMIALLESLGCDRFSVDFYSILDNYGKGNWRTAAAQTKKITNEFDEFHTRIKTAIETKKSDVLPEGQNESVPLKDYLKYLDDEEANRKLLILAVDDSPDILMAVSSILSGDYKVFKLPKPTMLENILVQMTPELFLLDYQMPELNGFDLIPIIRGFEAHKDTPIIFLTSEGTMNHVTAAAALGACDFIVKPFRADLLREKIAKHIVRKNHFGGA